MSADSFFQGMWYGRRQSASLLLTPLSWLFRALVAIRRWSFRTGLATRVRVGKPVIVVGNITVGGTGKTPIVLWLAEQLRDRGMRPGIIHRGYGGRSAQWPRDVTPASDPGDVGDEAVLLAQRFQGIVVAGPDRVAAARRAIERGADVIVSDDGLQHYRLARDCELAVVDASRGLGNGRMLPAGPLREPEPRLAQVDAILLKEAGTERHAGVSEPPPLLPASTGSPVPSIPFAIRATGVTALDSGEARTLASFRGQPVHAVAGIGNPEAFFATLREAGVILTAHALPDHAAIATTDLAFGDTVPILMTEKDGVKCKGFRDPRLWTVAAEADLPLAGATALMSIIAARIAAHPQPDRH